MTWGKGFAILETERLNLRQPRESDDRPLLAITQNEAVMRYYGMEAFQSEAEALAEIDWFNNQYDEKKGVRWIITVKPQDVYVGDVGFGYVARHARAELGFKLVRDHWRRGILFMFSLLRREWLGSLSDGQVVIPKAHTNDGATSR